MCGSLVPRRLRFGPLSKSIFLAGIVKRVKVIDANARDREVIDVSCFKKRKRKGQLRLCRLQTVEQRYFSLH